MKMMKVCMLVCSFAVLLGGCDTKTSQGSSSSSSQVATTGANSFDKEKLEKVQKDLSFQIVVPSDLPFGLTLINAMPEVNPNNGKAIGVTLSFQSPEKKYNLTVRQTEGEQLGKLGDNESVVQVNGREAKFASNGTITEMLWSNGSISYYAFSDAQSDLGEKETMVKVANMFE